MEYISAKEASQKWGIGIRRVQYFCANGLVDGAKYLGRQWIIPENAEKPSEKRKKEITSSDNGKVYHFPLLANTCNSAIKSELSDEENELINAQTLYFKGEYLECIRFCKNLLKSVKCSWVLVGCYTLISYCAMLSGLYSEYKEANACVAQLAEEETAHKEDYKLLSAEIKYHITWNKAAFDNLDIEKLSEQGLTHYQAILVLIATIDTQKETPIAVKVYELLCQKAENDTVLPTAMFLHSLLASLCQRNGDIEGADKHVKRACDIAIEQGWLALMAQFYTALHTQVDEYLGSINPDYVTQLRKKTEKNLAGWRLINKTEFGFTVYEGLEIEESEMILLLSYDIPLSDIAEIIGVPEEILLDDMDKICEKIGLSSREKLISYSKMQIEGMVL